MRLLFIIDPPQALAPKKDSTIALMRAAARRGDEVYYAEMRDLSLSADGVLAQTAQLEITEDDSCWMRETTHAVLPAAAFDAVFMRKEPPVDENFITATHLLDIVNRDTPVINHPRALREHNEKLAIFQFPELISPTWTGAQLEDAEKFRRRHDNIVLKPLNAMGGQGIYITSAGDLNFRSIFNTLSANGSRLIMAQAYLPAARNGDLRVFTVNGEVLPWMLARLPRSDDYRGNLAAGGTPEVRRLSREAEKIARAVAPVIARQGIYFAGLDIIGEKLIEINITCPTGLCEVRKQTGEDIAETVLEGVTAR